ARGPQLYFFAHSETSGSPLSSISRRPVSYIKDISIAGGSRNAAIAADIPGGAPAAGAAGAAAPVGLAAAAAAPDAAPGGGPVGANVAPRPGLPPKRPPDRLSHPSTLSLKKSVRTNLFEVMPPCE